MRTTVEIRDDQRAKLLELAGRRGEKGFSHIVEEALDRYFAADEGKGERIRRALEAIGSLDAAAADRLAEDARRIRDTWR
jgi:hypothetical protein